MVSAAIRLRALEEFTRAVGSLFSPWERLALALDKVVLGTGMEVAEAFLVEKTTGHSLLVCHRGLFAEAFGQITRFPLGIGYPGLVAAKGEAIATEDLTSDERYLRSLVKEAGFRSYFCLPLFSKEGVLGCLNITDRHRGVVTGDVRLFLEALGSGLSLALEVEQLRLVRELAFRAGETEVTLERVATTALDAVATACHGWGAALLFTPHPNGNPNLLSTWGAWRGAELASGGLPAACPARHSPRFSPCPEPDCPFAAGTGVCYPLYGKEGGLGVLCLGYSGKEAILVGALSLLPGAAPLVSLGLERTCHYFQVREEATQEERQRLAREIHDGVVQSLGLLRVKAEYLRRLAGQEPQKLAQELAELRRLAGEALGQLRSTIYSLPSAGLVRGGLVGILRHWARQMGRAYGLPVEVRTQGEEEALPFSAKLPLLRLAQEALSNALRHSGAKRVELELKLNHLGCSLLVRDDGRGFDPEVVNGGMGLMTMKERALSLGGNLVIHSAIGQGTEVRVWFPGGEVWGK